MAAVSLAACGGGGGDSSEGPAATTAPKTAGADRTGLDETGADSAPATGGGGSADSAGGSTGSGDAGSAPPPSKEWNAAKRARYERKRYGSPSARSAGFQNSAKQGALKHIAEFGDEAAAGERGAAQATLAAYLAAAEAGDWPKACGYALPYFIKTLEAASRSAGSARGCPEVLGSVYEEAAGQSRPRYPDAGNPQVASFRIEPYPDDRAAEFGVEEAGFALLHGSDGNDYYVSMTREGGQWKLTAPMPQPLAG